MIVTTRSGLETEALGERLGALLRAGDMLALYGDLGAGKTTLVRGLARGLGAADRVASPTFVLMHVYEGRVPVYHFDAYRLSGASDLLGIGADEYLEGDGVAVVEWSERAEGILPPERVDVHLSMGEGPDERVLRFEGRGRRGAEIVGGLS